jgi:hypothetical protein
MVVKKFIKWASCKVFFMTLIPTSSFRFGLSGFSHFILFFTCSTLTILMFQIYLCFSRSLSLWYLLHSHSWKPIINLKVYSYSLKSLSLFPLVLVLLSKLESKIDFCNFASYFTNPSPRSTLTLATWSSILFLRLIIVGMRSFMKNCNSSFKFFNKQDILR